ncbi:uncharacterized protein LOC144148279 [Haemaphysalis longicornis]
MVSPVEHVCAVSSDDANPAGHTTTFCDRLLATCVRGSSIRAPAFGCFDVAEKWKALCSSTRIRGKPEESDEPGTAATARGFLDWGGDLPPRTVAQRSQCGVVTSVPTRLRRDTASTTRPRGRGIRAGRRDGGLRRDSLPHSITDAGYLHSERCQRQQQPNQSGSDQSVQTGKCTSPEAVEQRPPLVPHHRHLHKRRQRLHMVQQNAEATLSAKMQTFGRIERDFLAQVKGKGSRGVVRHQRAPILVQGKVRWKPVRRFQGEMTPSVVTR